MSDSHAFASEGTEALAVDLVPILGDGEPSIHAAVHPGEMPQVERVRGRRLVMGVSAHATLLQPPPPGPGPM